MTPPRRRGSWTPTRARWSWQRRPRSATGCGPPWRSCPRPRGRRWSSATTWAWARPRCPGRAREHRPGPSGGGCTPPAGPLPGRCARGPARMPRPPPRGAQQDERPPAPRPTPRKEARTGSEQRRRLEGALRGCAERGAPADAVDLWPAVRERAGGARIEGTPTEDDRRRRGRRSALRPLPARRRRDAPGRGGGPDQDGRRRGGHPRACLRR